MSHPKPLQATIVLSLFFPPDVVFQFLQVGNDAGAKRMLEDLDICSEVGEYVDRLEGTNYAFPNRDNLSK